MDINNKSIENFNELIFENRHKAYGAYAIRKSYTNNVTFALFITSLSFCAIALTATFFNKGEEKVPDTNVNIIDSVQIFDFDFSPPTPPDDKKINKTIEKKPLKSDNLNYHAMDKEVETNATINQNTIIIKGGDEKGTDSAQVKDVAVKYVISTPAKDPVEWVDQMPEFDGNIYRFIKDHLKYPKAAIENGTFGTVGLSFVVETDGSIGAVKILNAVADGCTEEAIRVLKLMPKWKPGKNHGEPVRVWYNIPVKFRLK